MSILTDYLELQRSSEQDGSVATDEGQQGDSAAPPNRAAMNRLIMNYLVTGQIIGQRPRCYRRLYRVFTFTEGFKEAAEKFQAESGLPPSGELLEMDSRIMIRDTIQAGKIAEAVGMVHQIHPELLDDDRRLFFLLQQQQLIELIRGCHIDDALKFASEQLAERGEEDPRILDELERTMALLAFEDPTKSPYADLLSTSHRQKVASELNAALLRAEHAECTQPRLVSILKLMLWSQNELDKKGVRYTKVVDLAAATSGSSPHRAKESKQ